MNMTGLKITLKKLNGLIIQGKETKLTEKNKTVVLTVNAELMRLGFVLSEELFEQLCRLEKAYLVMLANKLIQEIKELVGDNVRHQPMYPNFPRQVMAASNLSLYLNAITHYWTFGEWKPSHQKLPRKFEVEFQKFHVLKVVSEDEMKQVFTKLLKSADSLSEEDKNIIAWFMENYKLDDLEFPESIIFAETRAVVAGETFKKELDISNYIETTTDILRVATYLSGGDVSLSENTKFKSLPRKQRRVLVALLERVIKEEDIVRHKNKWVRLFHNLHVGELSQDIDKIAGKARNNEKFKTFNSVLEALLLKGNIENVVRHLRTRPGEFARRLDKALRQTDSELDQLWIVEQFMSVVGEVPTRILLQLLGHMNRRHKTIEKRVVFPKGNAQKAVVIRDILDEIPATVLSEIVNGLNQALVKRFEKKSPLGKVWVDTELIDCPLPNQQRSTSEGLFSVARGTCLPIGEDSTLRFFIYWVGQDIDLSATFHDDRFNMIEQVSYTNLRSAGYKAYHSGDITSAPTGASEFIDLDILSALKYGARYVVMNVIVYDGATFAEHSTCFAGWMTRNKPNSNEIYDPRTVQQKN